jgi:hypothetical protein
MGQVYRPEDIVRKRERRIPDLTPTPLPTPTTPTGLEALLQETQSMKLEIMKIKQALRKHGISIE